MMAGNPVPPLTPRELDVLFPQEIAALKARAAERIKGLTPQQFARVRLLAQCNLALLHERQFATLIAVPEKHR